MDTLFASVGEAAFPLELHLFGDLPEDNFQQLHSAIAQKSYPRFYACLKKYSHRFSPRAAFALCAQAIEAGFTVKAVTALLERCPPAEEFLFADSLYSFPMGNCGLVEKAAGENRADLLALLLDRGGNVNCREGWDVSPLEAALEGLALNSVEVLAGRPELDGTWTDQLLNLWSREDPAPPALEFCQQTLVPRLFPGLAWTPLEPLPMPESGQMPLLAVQNGNWALAERLCRERAPIPLKVGQAMAGRFHWTEPGEQSAAVSALLALLEGCPGLLRGEHACRDLLRCWLFFEEEHAAPLRPWVDRLRYRRVAMGREDWSRREDGDFLALWQKRLPHGPTLMLDRWADVFDGWVLPFGEEAVALALRSCPIRGKARPGQVSPLARSAVQWGSAALLEWALEPGGLLQTEDAKALLDHCQAADCPRQARAMISAYVKQEVDYAL